MRSRRGAAPASTALTLTPAFVLLLALGGCAGLPPKPKPVVLPQEAPLPDAPAERRGDGRRRSGGSATRIRRSIG